MAINTFDQYIAAAKDPLTLIKNTIASLAFTRFSPFNTVGNPSAGTLAGTSTTTGVVPTDATAGCPPIRAFGGGAKGYLSRVVFNSSVAAWLFLGDLLWKAGAYTFNASTTGQSPTSFSSRVPGGTNYDNLEIWIEQVTAGTGIQSVNITYINQAGTAGRTGGVQSGGVAGTIGRMWRYNLQAGDTGVQGITGVVGTVATVGTFNVLIIRPLWAGRVNVANYGDSHGMDLTGMPEVFADSALYITSQPDSTATGIISLYPEIANA